MDFFGIERNHFSPHHRTQPTNAFTRLKIVSAALTDSYRLATHFF